MTCHINSQTLSQRDLAQIQFIYAREPAAHYLLQRNSGIEPWPKQLLEDYQEQLIPGHLCLQAWHEPVSSLRSQLMEGIEHFISEYPKARGLATSTQLQGIAASALAYLSKRLARKEGTIDKTHSEIATI